MCGWDLVEGGRDGGARGGVQKGGGGEWGGGGSQGVANRYALRQPD